MEKKVLFWKAETMKFVDRQKLKNFISSEIRKFRLRGYNYYQNLYEFLDKKLEYTSTIQIYQDGVIRLHCINNVGNIFFYDATDEMLEELVTFVKDN